MKKLLDELGAYIAKSKKAGQSNGYILGLRTALQIVRAHNPWHEVTELPLRDESEPDFSIDVLLTDGERCRVGYYAFLTGSWIMHRYFKKPVTGWTYLPEDKQ